MLKKLKIMGHIHSVKIIPNLSRDEKFLGRENCDNLKIELDPSYPRTTREETLLHEIIEVVNTRLQHKMEHEKISSLSFALYAVLKDNHLITEWEI
jgi:hypothetical protein